MRLRIGQMGCKAELHQHSRYSHPTDRFLGADVTVENIARTCKKKGISIFSITDHDSIENHEEGKFWAKKLDLLFIPGVEIGAFMGHVLAYGISEPIPKGKSVHETVRRIHEQNGIAVAAHPYQIPYANFWSVPFVPFDAVEAHHAYAIGNGLSRSLAKSKKLPVVAGSDAHYLDEIGAVFTIFSGNVRTSKDVLKAICEGSITTGGTPFGILKALQYRLQVKQKKHD